MILETISIRLRSEALQWPELAYLEQAQMWKMTSVGHVMMGDCQMVAINRPEWASPSVEPTNVYTNVVIIEEAEPVLNKFQDYWHCKWRYVTLLKILILWTNHAPSKRQRTKRRKKKKHYTQFLTYDSLSIIYLYVIGHPSEFMIPVGGWYYPVPKTEIVLAYETLPERPTKQSNSQDKRII